MNTIKRAISAALLITTAATNLAIAMDDDNLTTCADISTTVAVPVKPTISSESISNGIVPEWTDELTAHGITKADYDVLKRSLDAKPYKNFSINVAEGVIEFYYNEPSGMVTVFGGEIEKGTILPSSTMTTHELKQFRCFNIHRTLRQYIETLKVGVSKTAQTVVLTSPVDSDAVSSVVSDPLPGLRRDSGLAELQRVLHITDLNPIGTKETILIPTPTQTKTRWEAMTENAQITEATRLGQSTLESKSQRFAIDIQPELIDGLVQLKRGYFYDPAVDFMARWVKNAYSFLEVICRASKGDLKRFLRSYKMLDAEDRTLQLQFSLSEKTPSALYELEYGDKASDSERRDYQAWATVEAAVSSIYSSHLLLGAALTGEAETTTVTGGGSGGNGES